MTRFTEGCKSWKQFNEVLLWHQGHYTEKKKMSGGMNSIDAVKKKIKVLQEQAEEAEERAERLQKEVEKEKRTREEVCSSVLVRVQPPAACNEQTG
ncbi:hypothetical protein XENOCAPTIV_015690 [Xenoophorus captivus]|uniref:Uncharacterized protein n=1 Tax=Xenoophorus captivus TaxID=1517983 RepID=A0ABV0RQW7_9TELE